MPKRCLNIKGDGLYKHDKAVAIMIKYSYVLTLYKHLLSTRTALKQQYL
jgi:hypothetical protein